jgi:hypothetical protein
MKLSPAPDENRESVQQYLVAPRTRSLSEKDLATELEAVAMQLRGVKLAIAEAELEKNKVLLKAKRVDIGIAKLNLESTKQDFLIAAYKLVEKRARAAIAQDAAQSAVSEWRLNQDAVREKITGIHLQVQESEQKNVEKASDMKLRGFTAKLTTR